MRLSFSGCADCSDCGIIAWLGFWAQCLACLLLAINNAVAHDAERFSINAY